MWTDLQNIDTLVFLAINRSISNRFLDPFFLTVTEPGYYIVPALLAFIVFLRIDWKKTLVIAALAAVTVLISDTLCDDILKPLFSRPRPCHPEFKIQGARCIAGLKSSFSFPSAHAMNIFGQATLFAFLFPGKCVFFFAFAALIGLSRVYIGVHYPLDVAAGAICGGFIGMGVYAAYLQLRKALRTK